VICCKYDTEAEATDREVYAASVDYDKVSDVKCKREPWQTMSKYYFLSLRHRMTRQAREVTGTTRSTVCESIKESLPITTTRSWFTTTICFLLYLTTHRLHKFW